MMAFRQADPRFPFLWESRSQPPARWHGDGEGPVHYLADTPDGAWAELLRHEEITNPADIATIRRAMWAIDIGEVGAEPVRLSPATMTGDVDSYPKCQAYARRARGRGVQRLRAPSAALLPGGATGTRVADGERPALARDGHVIVIFGAPDNLVGWPVVEAGTPPSGCSPACATSDAADAHHVYRTAAAPAFSALARPPAGAEHRREA